MARQQEMENGARNHLAQGTVVKGDIIAEGNIRIDGELEGTLVSKAKVVLGPTGVIRGDVQCQTANIEGRIDGKMTVEEILVMKATGRFSGELVYGKISVEPGAEIEGRVSIAGRVKSMKTEGEKSREKIA